MTRTLGFTALSLLFWGVACSSKGSSSVDDQPSDGNDDSGGDPNTPVDDGLTEVGGTPDYDPTTCPGAQADGYTIITDERYEDYQIRKVGAVTFSRYEKNADGDEVALSEDYEVVTAFPKRYLLSEVHAEAKFPVEERAGYYVVDSNYELPHIPCVTDDVIYAPIVSGLHEPEVTERGQNKGWPIQQDIAAEVELYQGKEKMWVYTTWPGYRYGYWFKDANGDVRPTWLFDADDTTGDVTFTKYTPARTDWPMGAYNDVSYGLHIDSAGKVYVPKIQDIDFPERDGRPAPPTELKLAYKDWDSELRCVVINKSSALVANTRTIWPGGSEAYYSAESFLPGYAVIGQDSDGYWGLKGRETDAAAWWAGDDCVGNQCSGQSRFPYRNGCRIDSYDFGEGDGFNWLALKDHMIDIGIVLEKEELYRIEVYLQEKQAEPARMLAALYYEQDAEGRWQPKIENGTNNYELTQGDNPRYIMNGYIYPGQRIFAVIKDL